MNHRGGFAKRSLPDLRLMRLPRRADAQIRIRVAAIIVVDVQAVGIEVTDIDHVAVRRLHRCVLLPPRSMRIVFPMKDSPPSFIR